MFRGDAAAGSGSDLVVALLFRVGPDKELRGLSGFLEGCGEFLDRLFLRVRLAGVVCADVQLG